jgi:hypothetical protein
VKLELVTALSEVPCRQLVNVRLSDGLPTWPEGDVTRHPCAILPTHWMIEELKDRWEWPRNASFKVGL